MKRILSTITLVLMAAIAMQAQPLKTKFIDGGGTGLLKAIAVKEAGLPDFVV